GSGQNGLHVGIYDTNNQFIHASTSKGVMRSSLDNVYWQKNFWQARRI
ncbi:NlpC/P60 family protein, partial [Escherichia coli]